MADLPPEVARINALTSNARTTWFALLGVLVFVGITLMGVEHIDFYGVNRATKLPLVDVEVPTRLFFIAAPILTFAIYGYFHLYLIRLWDALGSAEPKVKRTRLGDAITPWLVSDAALHLRNKLRGDNCATPRALEYAAMVLNVALAWGFGLTILMALWLTSMVARSADMAVLSGAMLFASGWVGLTSWLVMQRRMRSLKVTDKRPLWSWVALIAGGTAAFLFVAVVSLERSSATLGLYPHAAAAEKSIRTWLARNDPPAEDGSSGANFALPKDFWSTSFLTLGPVNLAGEALVERPKDWLPHDIARAEFRPKWCAREGLDCKALTDAQTKTFEDEWQLRRRAQINALAKPEVNSINRTQYREWDGDFRAFARTGALNLRNADLRDAFLPGMNLVGADLTGARMEGADLENADLFDGQMDGVFLIAAQMQRALLIGVQMAGADLTGAQMEGSFLINAQMEEASLAQAQLEGADLSGSRIFGSTYDPFMLLGTNINASINEGGALRFADMTPIIWDDKTDFRSSFLDGTVLVSSAFRTRMGTPCQWVTEPLQTEEFFVLWAWWLDKLDVPQFLRPNDLRDLPHPTPERLEELGLTDCEPGQPFGPMPDTD